MSDRALADSLRSGPMGSSIPAAAEDSLTPRIAYTVGYQGIDVDTISTVARRAGVTMALRLGWLSGRDRPPRLALRRDGRSWPPFVDHAALGDGPASRRCGITPRSASRDIWIRWA